MGLGLALDSKDSSKVFRCSVAEIKKILRGRIQAIRLTHCYALDIVLGFPKGCSTAMLPSKKSSTR